MRLDRLRGLASWRLLGPIAVVLAVVWAGPAQVWSVLSKADLTLVGAAVALAIPFALLKGARWRSLLVGQGVEISFRESTSMYAMGMVMAAVTPGHVGDFLKIVPLVDRGCSLGRAVAYNVLDRLLDVTFVFLAGYAGLWYFSAIFASELWVANLAILVGLLIGGVLIARRGTVKSIAIRLVPERYRDAVRECWSEIVAGSVRGRTLRGIRLALWTAAFWPLQFLAGYLCARAVGVDVPFLYISACVAVGTIVSFLPITVGGAGTRDAAFIVLLGQIGIRRPESLAVSSLLLAVFLANCLGFYVISVLMQRGRG
ncbi:MAG: flippase-like domain-containing protein [Phycisphaerae bacterium]|nr:flippase-like domain-containing protein [Phycisphaerae bacterium]